MRKWLFILCAVILIFSVPVASFAGTVKDRIQRESNDFDPDKLGQQLDNKTAELYELARSGSALYIVISLSLFLVLLLGGLFFKKLIKVAFLVLGLSFVGYLLINYWFEIKDWFLAFIGWFFNEGGQT